MLPRRQFMGCRANPPLSSRAMSNSFHVSQVSRGQAYAILGGAALMMTLAMGIRQNLGLFQAPASKTSGITANIAARVVQPTRRTLAFGIVSAAGSVGTMLTAPIAAYMLNHDGWRAGLWAFAILAVAMLPAAWLGSRADKLPNSGTADRDLSLTGALHEARRHPGYVVMSIAFFVCGLQLVFLTTHLPTYLAQCGMDASYSALVLMLIGGFNVLSSWLFGWLGDKYPKRLLLGGIYLARSAALALFFLFPPTPLSVVLFGATMGVLWLGVIPLVNGLVVQIFGLRYLSTLTGIAFLSHQAGSFLGAWGGGYLFDLMGSYDLAWKIGVFIGLVAGTMQLLMNDRPTARMQALHAAAA